MEARVVESSRPQEVRTRAGSNGYFPTRVPCSIPQFVQTIVCVVFIVQKRISKSKHRFLHFTFRTKNRYNSSLLLGELGGIASEKSIRKNIYGTKMVTIIAFKKSS